MVAFAEGSNGQRVVFTPSDDGTLSAMDGSDGRVLWTYRSREATESRAGGSRMTDIRVLRFDAQRDGVIDVSDGDRVWLYFGVQSAGVAYYALDVTAPSAARLLWRIDTGELPGAGESWSTPTIARVKVSGATQNGEHFVLILGGGYDARANASGNRIFMVDAATGRLLWSASSTADGADLVLPSMRYPLPARVTAIDTDGDALVDRLYAADLGGQVWRFDIWNGRARESLVTGGVFASLGAASVGVPTPTALPSGDDARRFFNAPDVALIQQLGENPYYNIALGSGDAATLDDPSPSVHDRFYSLRDRSPFSALSQRTYDAATPILDADLVDVTGAPFDSRVPPEAAGWKLDLHSSNTPFGERVLAESVTANGVILFTTVQPGANGCVSDGAARVYAVKVDTAQPALDLNDDGQLTVDDLSAPLSAPGVPTSVQIELVPPGEGTPPIGEPPSPPTPGNENLAQRENARCRVGAEALAHCVPFRTLIRTFWRRHSTL